MVLSIEELEKISLIALNKSYEVHQKLGAKGEELIEINRFGETALKIDVEIEKAIINILKNNNVPMRIISEEHGTIDLCKKPIYLGVLDGLDGSKEYKNNRGKGRYGTMFGIFSKLSPFYDDYLFGGVMEHSTKKIFYVSKGRGSFVIVNGKKQPIYTSNCKKLNEKTRIYIDIEFDKNRGVTFMQDTFLSKLEGYKILFQRSTAAHYVDLASGQVDLILECTRKGNLEMAVAYGLIKEAGGVMVTSKGTSWANKKYLEYGQDKNLPVISASTNQLAKVLIKQIN